MPPRLSLGLSSVLQLFLFGQLLINALSVATNQGPPFAASYTALYRPPVYPNDPALANPHARLGLASNHRHHCNHARHGIFEFNVPDYANKTQLHKISSEELKKFEAFFDDVPAIDVGARFGPPQVPEIRNRMNSNPEEIELCDSVSRVVHPLKGQTLDSGWQYILQTGEHKQGVLEEYCDKEDQPCKFTEIFPQDYVTRCKQYYSYRTMVAINDGVPSKKEFLMRSTCKCVIRMQGHVPLG